MRIFILMISMSILLTSTACEQQESSSIMPPLVNKLDSLIQAANEEDLFHGNLVISKGEEILYSQAIGIANREWDIPFTDSTRLDVASVNKSMIAFLILKAVEEDKLQLETSLRSVLTELGYSTHFDENISLHQMLTHTAGLGDYSHSLGAHGIDNFKTLKRLHFTNPEYVAFIDEIPMIGEPGQQFYYSNFAYHLLCIILEETYQTDFNSLLQEKLCKPLGLKNTFSSADNEAIKPRLAEAYNYDAATNSWKKNNFIDLTMGRRIFSTAQDLHLWAKSIGNEQLLASDLWKKMTTNHISHLSEELSYGYGWVVHPNKSQVKMGHMPTELPFIIHGGSTEGYKSMLININEGQYIISFLSNVGDQTNEIKLAQQIIQILNNHL